MGKSEAYNFPSYTTQQLIPSFMQENMQKDQHLTWNMLQGIDEQLPMQQYINSHIHVPQVCKSNSNKVVDVRHNPMSFLPFPPTGDEKTETILPTYFKPGPYSVIIGRGKECRGNIGNRRLRVLASRFLEKYADAPNKATKSRIVATIVTMMREACPLGAFVRLRADGRWYEVKEAVASEKVGYTMRELLGEMYKSSSRSRVLKRHRSNEEAASETSSVDSHKSNNQKRKQQPSKSETRRDDKTFTGGSLVGKR